MLDLLLSPAEVNQRMVPWGDAEIRRYTVRVGLLQRRGLSEPDASQLSDRLALRDQQRDDRRVCLECASFQRSRTCAQRLPTSPLQLIRCHGFTWSKPA